ncbi:MAG TPA: bifunctional demethylmenaquinone methyltransferase/2-methoxy-6-polyprenyl-1,4-benzoquinol methylase UbiE [Rhodospirillaceae bacterium]|jgi:demethylmenaquinone methyltransferase/2-methoxy-6-polyprenyl-1,4-benzoquinol methylase|nr:bifunctional demethylmenaquinone methyltransferase/2-methoxy-6-polyprenyl-1,4-benzoquinol methylase UbiE [Alphaproteobacteria bacterium]HBH25879.1 bifunctional demethylmenaquinone methyltransferase/2-methoxy-6-polyprenyl-1,4-benzoquinol methylase UbiE [Rhodospirillaceae bacterium]
MTVNPESAQFGFRPTDATEKPGLVDRVFTSVASKYDLMNDLMSMGIHRLWKNRFVRRIAPTPGKAYLDVAGGTGDIARRLARRGAGSVTVCDPSAEMVACGAARAVDAGLPRITWALGRAEALPFPDATFDVLTIAFGLRNVTRIDDALAEFARVLRPGGRAWVLEFTPVERPVLKQAYDAYAFDVLPRLGALVARDSESYQYLAESIRAFPSRAALAARMEAAGFSGVAHEAWSAGIVAVHTGLKAL